MVLRVKIGKNLIKSAYNNKLYIKMRKMKYCNAISYTHTHRHEFMCVCLIYSITILHLSKTWI